MDKSILEKLPNGDIVGNSLIELVLVHNVLKNVNPNNIKQTSIDVTLYNVIELEDTNTPKILTPGLDKLSTTSFSLENQDYILKPNEFILGGLNEIFDMPLNVSATFFLTSTFGRIGVQHSIAINIVPGWQGMLTLELFNHLRYSSVKLVNKAVIGTIIFRKHNQVMPYTGKYNNLYTVLS